MSNGQRRLKVFISYSHNDQSLRDELEAHLSMLKNSEIIETWHDGKIAPGADWEERIATNSSMRTLSSYW